MPDLVRAARLAVGALGLTAACAEPYAPPSARISELLADEESEAASACRAVASPFTTRIGAAVPVTAACSSDPNFLALSYHWSLAEAPVGSAAVLQHADAVSPTLVPDLSGSFRLRLVVSDGVVTSEPALLDVAVGACGGRAPSVVTSASSASPRVGEPVTLAADVQDADTEQGCAAHPATFGYEWALAELPAASRASLNAPSARSPSFVPDVPGKYLVRVSVTDPTGRTSEAGEVAVDAVTCGGNPPVIRGMVAEPSPSPATGEPVTLRPDVADADLDAGCAAHAPVFSADWRFMTVPDGSVATFVDPRVVTASFTPDVPGEYVAVAVIADPTGRSATQTFTVTANICGSARPVASAAATPENPSVGDGVELRALVSDADTAATCALRQTFGYVWRLAEVPAGSAVVLGNAGGQVASLRPDVPGTYAAELVVTDSTGRVSEPTSVRVTVGDCGLSAPVAAASRAGPGPLTLCSEDAIATDLRGGHEILLDAEPSSDADNTTCALGQVLDYDWTLLTTPLEGGGSRLFGTDGRTTVLRAQSDGEYRVRLVVTDSTGRAGREAVCVLRAVNAGH